MHHLALVSRTIPKLAFMLGGSSVHAVILFFQFTTFLIAKKVRKSGVGWRFDLTYTGKPFSISLFEGSPDIAALKEIFIDGEYTWDGIVAPRTIVDLGAHTGNTALYFHLKYPEAIIYAIEASPKNYARLIANVGSIPSIKPVFGAVSDADGQLTFYESESSLGSSVVDRGGNTKAVEVPCFTLKTLFEKQGISKVDLMKIDIEGAEERLFTNDLRPEAYSRSYMIEVHGDLMKMEQDFSVAHFKGFTTTTRHLPAPERYLLYATVL